MNHIVVEEVEHSVLGASSAHRWMNCPGSINLVDSLIKGNKSIRTAGYAAREGTAAHEMLARCLLEGKEIWEFAGATIEVEGDTFEFDDDMQEAVTIVSDFVDEKLGQYPKSELFIEKPLSSITNEQAFGTPDIVIVVPGDRIIVVDFKYGRGVVVEPTEAQLKYYAYLCCEKYLEGEDSVKVVELWIAQPRIPHPKGTIRRHVANVSEINEFWFDEVLPAMEETENPEAKLVMGDHCRFCPAKSNCPALRGEVLNFPIDSDPSFLSSEELGDLMDKKSAIVKCFESLEKEAYARAIQGDKVPGYKLVKKRANRIFKDGAKKAAEKKFGDECYNEPTFKTPPNIEKLTGGKQFVKKWAYSPDNGLTLAPLSDKRSEVLRAMEAYMDSVDNPQP
jgi:hypothetical protein